MLAERVPISMFVDYGHRIDMLFGPDRLTAASYRDYEPARARVITSSREPANGCR